MFSLSTFQQHTSHFFQGAHQAVLLLRATEIWFHRVLGKSRTLGLALTLYFAPLTGKHEPILSLFRQFRLLSAKQGSQSLDSSSKVICRAQSCSCLQTCCKTVWLSPSADVATRSPLSAYGEQKAYATPPLAISHLLHLHLRVYKCRQSGSIFLCSSKESTFCLL